MKPEYLLTPEDRTEIDKRLKRLGFKDITWRDGDHIDAIHPTRDIPNITEPIRRMGFHVGAGGSPGGRKAYATVWSREYEKAFRKAWDDTGVEEPKQEPLV